MVMVVPFLCETDSIGCASQLSPTRGAEDARRRGRRQDFAREGGRSCGVVSTAAAARSPADAPGGSEQPMNEEVSAVTRSWRSPATIVVSVYAGRSGLL